MPSFFLLNIWDGLFIPAKKKRFLYIYIDNDNNINKNKKHPQKISPKIHTHINSQKTLSNHTPPSPIPHPLIPLFNSLKVPHLLSRKFLFKSLPTYAKSQALMMDGDGMGFIWVFLFCVCDGMGLVGGGR